MKTLTIPPQSFKLGQINDNGTKRAVTLKIKLIDGELSFVGDIKNSCVGQCQDEIEAYFKDSELFKMIYPIWQDK